MKHLLSDISDKSQPERLLFVLGSPRSGTTWLAKLFDSHPDVLYRHEPDAIIRDFSFPLHCEPADMAHHEAAARAYVQRLLDVRVPKSAGTWPIFRKSYHGFARSHLRTAMVASLWAANRVPLAGERSKHIPIPDLFVLRSHPALHTVIKSVSSLGRAGLFAQALPGSRFVLIVRHPCGYVASMLRGDALGKFRRRFPADQVLGTSYAGRYGLTREHFEALSRPEQLAWNWVINNEKALAELGASAKVRLVRYEDLCHRPKEEMEALFAFADLSWTAQTEDFIGRSTSYRGPDFYYGVLKDTDQVVSRWCAELSPEDKHAIIAVVSQTTLSKLFPEPGRTRSVSTTRAETP